MFRYSFILLWAIICLIVSSFCRGNETPLLLYSTMYDIRLVNTTRAYKPEVIIKNTKNSTSYIATLDYHYALKKIFWADHENESIFSVDYYAKGNITNKMEIVTDVVTPDGLACDWVTNKLYWTDSETNHIEVATIEGKYRKVLFWTDIDQPRAIALVPSEGFMFWTDWGELPKIERASMDGAPKSRKTIVSDNIFWPNGLTIDYKTKHVYWADGKLKFIKRMDYDGKSLVTVLDKASYYPFALTQLETKMYWTDWETGAIHYYDTSGQQKQPLELLSVQNPMDIHVWDPQHQPNITSPCQVSNGGCSHLCLLSQDPSKFTCACPMGFKLIDNKTCYDKPQELLLLAKRPEIRLIYLDSPEYSSKALPLDVKYSIAVDFDPVDNYIYWSDDEVKTIQKAKIDGTEQQDVIWAEIQHPDGIALDWIARNIYWTDAGTDRIEVSTLTGGYRKVIIMDKLHDPRGIAVAPELGWLFWSDWNEKEPKIERCNLDGSERVQIVTENLGWPNGITLDHKKTRIYWGDAKLDKIEYSDMDGSNRRELIDDNVPHVFGFTLMGDYIYWTDWQRRAIDKANKETGGEREVIVDQMENVMGLKAINLNGAVGWNLCKENNGNCSQLCLYKHNKERVCACQIDHELKRDGQTCIKPKAFLLYSKRANIGRIGIENENYEVTVPIAGIKHASAIDFDTNTMRIYWSDSKLRTIMRAFLNGSDIQRVIDLGLTSPEGIAVDWLGLNIYWTDPVSHRIEVSRLMGRSRRTLLWNEAYEPHSIVVDPGEGYLYWSEWGTTNFIKKAAMDGKNQSKLISTVNPANSLTLDYEKKRLYWTEKDTPAILSSDLNGNDQRVVVKDNILEPVGLTLYKEFIYWSDNKTGEVFRASKSDGSNRIRMHKLDGVTDLLVHYQLKSRNTNQCATSNGGCSHLCLALPPKAADEQTGYTCACPNHYTLNQKECIPPVNFMIYSLRNLVVRLVPDTSDCPEAVLPIQALKAVKAIDYDQRTNYLYWIDSKARAIKKSEATEQRIESGKPKTDTNVVSSHKEIQPFDIALDPLGRLLFWTCEINDVINVTYLENQNSFGNLGKREGERPRLIALHVDKRLLFYTDIGKTPQLVRVRLDGSHRIVITKAANITAIAVDTENDLIVWAQGHGIYISNIDGENQHVVLNESNSIITQLTVHLGFLYWIDKELDQLQRIEILSGKSRSTLPIQASHILDLISVKHYTENLCSRASHKCSHFCIHNSSSLICACPHGKILNDDRRTCLVPPHCGDDRFTCNIPEKDKTECIPIAWKCDRQKDCGDGSDEADCPKCLPDQFRCLNGQCIDKKNYCDNFPHCSDRSDEKNCCENGFQCPQTEVCLPSSLVCDGNENCADGSDEKDCRISVKPATQTILLSFLACLVVFVVVSLLFFRKKLMPRDEEVNDQMESLNPMHPNGVGNLKYRKGIPDIVRMSMLNDSGCPSSFDRRHVTGTSSSSNTNGSSVTGYPCETLNPPPSPATTAASTRASSPSRYRPYRHYRSINQPPPPTPCSTDINDESDYNYPTKSRYDGGPFPPPPTPRSVCHQESCPPSPSSRSSTYFSPLPPPPSPVASPRGGYDS
ncbi:low-density lipoprotein receptor-related protein 6 [Diabrotica virgifera virgifera]|uniref:Low-density lipoprotein receptor-related protein 6 n=1 Tax=Diabrotica virgifera virgifera TaxID=50390 RepID=A0A6P7F1Z4_DIAVI|nr:low-density lipoprotein receptor-related protein 6 [Diabrotica virgifera virgifera]